MKRGIQSLLVIVVVISIPLFWLMRPVGALPAYFAREDCVRMALKDADSGRANVGGEDMALLPDGDRLILSAIDWLAYTRHPSRAPEGGIYKVSLTRLAAGDAWAQPIIQPGAIAGGLFPHGVAVSSDGRRLAFVNRDRDDALFDDPAGALFSGSTVAVLAGGTLVAGSVRDAGLLLCRKSAT